MTDWADEIAKKLVYMTNTGSERGIERANGRLAAALREARNAALEEAAAKARSMKDQADAAIAEYQKKNLPIHYIVQPDGWHIAAAIRALKDKQP